MKQDSEEIPTDVICGSLDRQGPIGKIQMQLDRRQQLIILAGDPELSQGRCRFSP
jgi:hypothetical protein